MATNKNIGYLHDYQEQKHSITEQVKKREKNKIIKAALRSKG